MKTKKLLTSVLAGSMLLGGLAGCSGNGGDRPIKNIAEPKAEVNLALISKGESPDYNQKAAADGYNEFALKLFSTVAKSEDKGVNVMVSPASVMFALDLADAGACKNTLAEINKVIGGGDLTPEQQQAFASQWMKDLNASEDVKFSVANAIWSNKELIGDKMNPEYIEFVEKLYEAKAKSMKFDDGAKSDINKWVNEKTKGMIDKVIDNIDPSTAAFLVNAIAFEGAWEEKYESYQVTPGTFRGTNGNGDAMMMTEASPYYYESDKAIGFSKMYEGGRYCFVAILPKDENTDANSFMTQFTGDDYAKFIASKTADYDVTTKIPKFKNDYDVLLNDALKDMGIKDAFDPAGADFTGIAHTDQNLFISKVIHKTFIDLDENGTKAAAVTAVSVECAGIMPDEKERKEVICDRPFGYMIVDCENNKPVFIGTVNNI
ncbi:MAG: serpin family protein [Clostridiales bacterium]|nr:serpin family protein [Clostridiales bacterium]